MFRLRSPLAWFYEETFRWGLDLLRQKCGSSSTLKEFRRLLGKIIEDDEEHDHLPDYSYTIDGNNAVVRPKKETRQPALPLPLASLRLDPDIHSEARRLAPGWDPHALEADWRSWVIEKGISVKNADKHFLSFCKKKGPYPR